MDSVAIIILTKNNFEVIKKCLNSFKEKNTYTNIKFYIGDTGSDKDCLSNLENYLDSLNYKKELLKFNYYNFAKNHNWIIKNRVKERFILFCNDDIELIDDPLPVFINNWESNLGTMGCKLLFSNNTIQHAGQKHIINEKNYVWTASHKLYKQPNQKLEIEYNVGNTFAFCMTERDTYDRVGGLNEDYIQCFEDVEYNINCSLNKMKHKFIGPVSCYHHESLSRKKTFVERQEPEDFVRLKLKMQELYSSRLFDNMKMIYKQSNE